jgi:hypothetical protein
MMLHKKSLVNVTDDGEKRLSSTYSFCLILRCCQRTRTSPGLVLSCLLMLLMMETMTMMGTSTPPHLRCQMKRCCCRCHYLMKMNLHHIVGGDEVFVGSSAVCAMHNNIDLNEQTVGQYLLCSTEMSFACACSMYIIAW